MMNMVEKYNIRNGYEQETLMAWNIMIENSYVYSNLLRFAMISITIDRFQQKNENGLV